MGCSVFEVEDVVKVSGPLVMLFDVLPAVDAFGALLTAAAVLGFLFAWHENLDLSGKTGITGFPGAGSAAACAAADARSVSCLLGTPQGGLGTYLCQDWGSAQHLVQHCLRAKLGGHVGGRGSCSSPFAGSV